jgi:exosortase
MYSALTKNYLLLISLYSLVFWGIFSDTGEWIIHSWMHNSFYTHGFIMSAICLAVLLINGRKLRECDFQAGPGVLPGVISLALVAAGSLLHFHFLIGLAYVLGALSLNRMFVTRNHLAFVQLPFWIVIMVLPIPFLNELSGYLGYAASRASAFILGALFASVEVDGIAVIIPGGISFNIDMSCSGATSIFALMTVVILWLALLKHRAAVTSTLIALTLPVGFCANVMRIVMIFVAARIWGVDSALVFWHDFAAYLFYGISLGMLFCGWICMKRLCDEEIRLRRLLIA